MYIFKRKIRRGLGGGGGGDKQIGRHNEIERGKYKSKRARDRKRMAGWLAGMCTVVLRLPYAMLCILCACFERDNRLFGHQIWPQQVLSQTSVPNSV